MDVLVSYWWLLLIILVVGVLIGLLARNYIKRSFSNFFTKAFLLKGYWKFVIPFFVLVVVGYYLVVKYADQTDLQTYLSILGTMSGLVFAIFIGYYAFLQVLENRQEKFIQQAFQFLRDDYLERAREYFEKAYLIDTKDFGILATLLELHLMLKEWAKFNDRITLLEKEIIEDKERLLVFYLKAAKNLLQQDLGNAKTEIAALVSFIRDNADVLNRLSWNFGDLRDAKVTQALTGDPKQIFLNLCDYLQRSLPEQKREAFESGTYEIVEVPAAGNAT